MIEQAGNDSSCVLTEELILTETNRRLLKQTPFPEAMKDFLSPVQKEKVKETGYKK